MKVSIFAAGTITNLQSNIVEQQQDKLVIAADGGARHCIALGIKPDVVIGDFDSLVEQDIVILNKMGSRFISYSARKDQTDLELAIQHACEQNASQITIYGALGQRWDQSLANLMLLASPGLDHCQTRLVDGLQEAFLIRSGTKIEIHGQPGDTVSLIPIGGNASGIRTRGLEYALENETLVFAQARGVSNVLSQDKATVELQHGLLVCIVIHKP